MIQISAVLHYCLLTISPAISHPLGFTVRPSHVCMCESLAARLRLHAWDIRRRHSKSLLAFMGRFGARLELCISKEVVPKNNHKDCFVVRFPNHTAVTGSNQLCYKQMCLMCTSWVSRGSREYSLWNHTGLPALWSSIRLALRPNYSQSQPIKSNYGQLWIIRMPQRLIARWDGAVGCHFQKTVTGLSLHLCPNQWWIFSLPALKKKDFRTTIKTKTPSVFCFPIWVLSSFISKFWRFPL